MKWVTFKLGLLIVALVSLTGCMNDSENLIQDEEVKDSEVETEIPAFHLEPASIEDELSHIETLIGVEEFQAAKNALDLLLSELDESFMTDEQVTLINELQLMLSEVEWSDEEHNHEFTGVDAVALAIERYGADDDIVYMYDDNHEHYGDDQIGYYVALKSKRLEAKEDSDGIVLMLFVGDDGSITEL